MSLLLEKITLVQFKNYQQQQFEFASKIIGITGKNGAGKTNLLDAIYYLCFTRSYFSANEGQNILYHANGFRVEGWFHRLAQTEKITVLVKEGKKEFRLNGAPYTKFSRHIGLFPAVMIAPDDIELILGGSEARRKFMDALLSQLDATYLEQLITYNKVLQQRNRYLKRLGEGVAFNAALMETFDQQLHPAGTYLFEARKKFLTAFTPQVQRIYDYLAGSHEQVTLVYESALHQQSLEALLRSELTIDRTLQRTTQGIHKDDLLFLLDGQELKAFASQGQRKSFLFALKLAQYEVLKLHLQLPPLLLLDDIFEKLDSERIQRLIKLVCSDEYGQVFITDTHKTRLCKAFEMQTSQLQLIEIERS